MQIQFIGADRTVTGSMHRLIINGKSYLLDCGMYQGKRKEAFELNRTFDLFNPKDIDALILSHAHIDHCGNIPGLVKNGFNNPVYCTPATKDLAIVMLKDSAHIQEKDVEFVNKKRKKQGKNLFEPLYTQADAEKVFPLLTSVNYHEIVKIDSNLTLQFFDAGHILGSAIVFLTLNGNGRILNLGFSGDLGRFNIPILKDPESIPGVDYFICESTYGGRLHDNIAETESKLIDVINKAVSRKGKIIIPAFSLERTQELVYAFHKIVEKKAAPKIPIYVDSPLSSSATAVFRNHPECYDRETLEFMKKFDDPFGFDQLTYITDVEDSKKLNVIEGPVIIISASGMAETGRILHHLANNIENEKNIILMVGYCAENTLGKKIIDKEPVVKIFGDEYKLKAEVIVVNSLSAHADSKELINYCTDFDRKKMQNIFIVHGEFDQQQIFANNLKSIGFEKVTIPSRGDIFEI
jgi:metallo-beta-lactamase family protein